MKLSVIRCGGLIVAPALWAINTQFGLMPAYAGCGGAAFRAALVAFAAFAIATAASLISWRRHATARIDRFIMRLSLSVGMAFAFAIGLQGAATLLLDACGQ